MKLGQAIRAIGRGTRRVTRFTLRAVFATLIVATALYLVLNIWYYSGDVRMTRDVVAEITAVSRAAPPEQRAWPLYRRALHDLPPTGHIDIIHPEPGDQSWEHLANYVTEHADEIAILREGAAKAYLGFVPGEPFEGESLHSERLGQWEARALREGVSNHLEYSKYNGAALSLLRRAGLCLLIDAAHAWSQGDAERAIDDYIACIQLAGHCREHPTQINDLVSLSLYVLVTRHVRWSLHRHAQLYTTDQLERLDQALLAFMDGDIRGRRNIERLVIDDIVQRSFTDNGRGGGHIIRPRPGAATLFHAETVQAYDRLYAIMNELRERPYFEQDDNPLSDAIDELTWGTRDTPMNRVPVLWKLTPLRWGDFMFHVPPVKINYTSHQFAGLQRDATRTAIALHRFRREHDRWPADLQALVPQFLPAVPTDIFDGEPLRYTLNEDGNPVIYSIGANLEDDGGVYALDENNIPTNETLNRWYADRETLRRHRERNRGWRKLPFDADFILYPPLPEKPVEPTPDAH